MSFITAQVTYLREHILKLEKRIATVEAEIAEVKRDMGDFEERYNRIVKPISEQLDAVQAAIRSLEELRFKQQMGREAARLENLWRTQNTDETPPPPPDEDRTVTSKPVPPGKLKKLYRDLARRYHPDMAKTPEEQVQYTRIMSLINTAYVENDIEALRALSQASRKETPDQNNRNSDVPLAVLELRRLQQESYNLEEQLRQLQSERDDMKYGPLMDLKIQESIARSRGENFLEQLAAEIEAEYWEEMKKLDSLRRDVK